MLCILVLKNEPTMYKKIAEYSYCDIYKHISRNVYISAFDGEKIAKGKLDTVKQAAINYLKEAMCPKSL